MSQIIENRKARFDYFIEKTIEAGLCLEGWEVKSLRQGKCQLVDSYVRFFDGEAFLVGALITPLQCADRMRQPDDRRDRKLLLKRSQLDQLKSLVDEKGKTLICTSLYWKDGRVKAAVAISKGKKNHDKRNVEKSKTLDMEMKKASARYA